MIQPTEKKIYKIIDFLHTHIIGVIIAVVVVACVISTMLIVSGKISDSKNINKDMTYKDMDTLYFPISQLTSIDPLKSTDEDIFYINQLMYSSLFKLNDNLNIENDIVDSYSADISSGKLSIQLKPNIEFSDGSSLTSKDIKFTVNTIKKIGSSSPYYAYVSKIDGISISDETNLTVSFANASDSSLDNLVFPIVSSESYDKTGGSSPVGSGPYAFSAYDGTTYLDLVSNSHYFGKVPTNKIRFKVMPNVTAATGLMTTDSLTAYVNTSNDADSDAEDKNLKHETIVSNEAEYLAFNFANSHLSSKKIRIAIGKAIDTKTIVKDNYGGNAVISDSIYFPGFLGTENGGDAYPFNQSEAIKELRKEGYKDIDEDGVLEDKSGNKLSLKLIVNSNNTGRVDAATSIAENLKNIGISVNIEKLDWDAYLEAYNSGAFDMALGGYKFDKQYDLRALFSGGNPTGYSDEKVMAYLNALETPLSAEEQKVTYEKLKEQLVSDAQYYCLCYKTYSFVTAKKFVGEKKPTYFDRYRGCDGWKWQKAIVSDAPSDTHADKNN